MVVARLCPQLGRLLLAPLELVGWWVATLFGGIVIKFIFLTNVILKQKLSTLWFPWI